MPYGVTSTGFVIKRLADIIASIKTRLQAVDVSVDLEDSTLISQQLMISAEEISQGWEAVAANANAFDPNYNFGPFQSGTVQLNGIIRRGSTPTKLQIQVSGDAAAVVTAGAIVAYDGNQFAVDDDITIGALPFASGTIQVNTLPTDGKTITIGSITYTIEDGTLDVAYEIDKGSDAADQATKIAKAIMANGTAGTDYGTGTLAHPDVTAVAVGAIVTVTAKVAGTLGNTIAMSTTSANLTVSPLLLGGLNYGTATGYATSNLKAPVVVPDDAALSINSPLPGWRNAVCLDTAVAGDAEESDEELRIRQRISTQLTAQREAEAILAAVQNVSGVTYAMIYENPTDTVDAKSIPSGAVCVLAIGGVDADICDAIYGRLSCMTRTFGNVEKAYDLINVYFQRPIDNPCALAIAVKATGVALPADYETQIKNKVIEWTAGANGYTPGQTVYASDLFSPLNELEGMYFTAITVGSADTVKATGWALLNTNPADGDTVTVGAGGDARVYRFKTTPAQAYDVRLSTAWNAKEANAERLVKCIMDTGVEGVSGDYYSAVAHPTVSAVLSGATALMTAKTGGTAGNSIALASSNATRISVSGATLTGGSATQSQGALFTSAWNQIASFLSANITVTTP